MQGHKPFVEKPYLQFRLSERIPTHNFYRRLKGALDWDFLYAATEPYYGKCGHCSIDAVVFFKLVLVGYLENITSDRKLIEHCSLRLDILYFLDYNLDELLPWHGVPRTARSRAPDNYWVKKSLKRCLTKCLPCV